MIIILLTLETYIFANKAVLIIKWGFIPISIKYQA